MHYGWGQDFLVYIFNENLLLGAFLGDSYQHFNPSKRRIVLWCTQTLAFLFACALVNHPLKTVLNIFVVSPLLLITNTYVYYMFVCPCTQTRNLEDETKRRNSHITKNICICLQKLGLAFGSLSVILGFIWLLILHITLCEHIEKEYLNSLLDYTLSIFVATVVLDIMRTAAKFVALPFGITICGFSISFFGEYYFEKVALAFLIRHYYDSSDHPHRNVLCLHHASTILVICHNVTGLKIEVS